MNVNDAFIEIADQNGYTFLNASNNDVVFYQTNSNQTFQIGACVGARANISMTRSTTVIDAPETISLRTNGQDALSISASGNVSLANGIATPAFTTSNLYTAAGTQSRPSHTFANDDRTGLYQPELGHFSIATASTERVRVTSGGDVGIGIANPTVKLDVAGTVQATDFVEFNVPISYKYAPSNTTTYRLDVLDTVSTWTSNNLSNLAISSSTTSELLRIDAMAYAGCNAAVWSSNKAFWLSNNALPLYAISNDIFRLANDTSNTLSNYVLTTEHALTSNAAFWSSNQLQSRPTAAAVDATYAKSNETFLGIASNTAKSAWASNVALWGSNTVVSTSNALFTDYLTKTDAASSYATLTNLNDVSSIATFGCNTSTWTSNALPNLNTTTAFASNTSVYASNLAVTTSNAMANYALTSDVLINHASSNAQSNWNYGSNTSTWASNTASWGSNTFLSAAIASNAYAASNRQSNWNYASNTATLAFNAGVYASNALPGYMLASAIDATFAKSNAQSNWNFASNQSALNTAVISWTSNTFSNYATLSNSQSYFAQSNAQSNWVYASNTSTNALNQAMNAVTTSTWTSNATSNFAALVAQSNWVYASNTARAVMIQSTWTSNELTNFLRIPMASNYADSNAQSNWVYASNTSFWASNTAISSLNTVIWASNSLASVATTEGTSNWNFASNTAIWASNEAAGTTVKNAWTSNALSNFALSISNSNWDYASNTATWSSNKVNWASNSLADKISSTDATQSFAAMASASNWNFASNTSYWASNTSIWSSNNFINYVLTDDADVAYAPAVAQSNWNYASNTAFHANGVGIWASNQFPSYTTTTTLLDTLNNYALSNEVYPRVTTLSNDFWATSNVVWGCNGSLAIWASNNFRNYITTVAANNTNAAIYGSNTSSWTSNEFKLNSLAFSNKLSWVSNVAYTASNNVASNGIAGIWSSNKLGDYILRAEAGQYFLSADIYQNAIIWSSNMIFRTSNVVYPLSANMSNFILSNTSFAAFASSNGQSNWNYASNAANYASNTLPSYLLQSLATLTYAASNNQSNWNFASNTATWGSNNSSNLLTLQTASNAYALSNRQVDWNFASNTAMWTSNNTSNLVTHTFASNTFALSNSSSNWNFASNTAAISSNVTFWSSNQLSNVLLLSAASNNYAFSNQSSNWVFASNTAFISSNTSYWASNNTSNLLLLSAASNNYAFSNQTSNWVFASNVAAFSSNISIWNSNNSSNYLQLSSASTNYAASNQLSNLVYASNTSFAASNTSYWSSNQLSNVLLLTVASNNYLTIDAARTTYAASNAQSNWVFSSNTAVISSNTAFWSSNSLSNYLSSSMASSSYAFSNAQSNWVYASNTAFVANSTATWSSNALSNQLTIAAANNVYAPFAGQSNWNFASNTSVIASNVAYWSSNSLTNTLSLSIASNSYAVSNAQSNWNYGSNTASWLSNNIPLSTVTNATWASNNSGGRYWIPSGTNTYTMCNVGIITASPLWQFHVSSVNATTTSTIIATNSNNSNYLALYSGRSNDADQALIYGCNTALRFGTWTSASGTGWTERMRLTSNGFLGINTTSPIVHMDVNGAMRATGVTCTAGVANAVLTMSNSVGIAQLVSILTAGNYSKDAIAGDFVLRVPSTSNKIILQTGAEGAAGLTITGANNIGIGDPLPAYKLDVNGTCQITSNLFFGSTTRQMVNLWGTSHAIGVQSGATYLRTSADLHFFKGGIHSDTNGDAGTGGTTVMSIKSSYVGIANTNPTVALDIVGDVKVSGYIQASTGNTNSDGYTFQSNPGGGAGDSAYMRYFSRSGEASTLELGTVNDTDDHISLMPSGNVGINTRTPAYELDVKGQVQAYVTTNSGMMVTRSNAGPAEITFNATNIGGATQTASVGIDSSTSRDFFIWVNGADRLLIDSATGNVGIGTTPHATFALQVDGDTLTNGYIRTVGNNGWYNQTWGGGWYMNDATWVKSFSDKNVYTGGTIACIGNLGVGTSNPAFKLDVNGTANFKFRNDSWITSAEGQNRFLFTGSGRTFFSADNGFEWRNTADTNIGVLDNIGNLTVPGEITSTTTTGYGQFRAIGGGYGMIFRNDGATFYLLPTASNNPTGIWTNSVYPPLAYGFGNRLLKFNAGLTVGSYGNIGINVTPSYPLHIAAGENSGAYSYGYLNNVGTGTASVTSTAVSIWADYRVVASEFNARSDSRIKKDIVDIDDISALNVIRQIEPKQYSYIDTISKGNTRVWGFIAQQVESVIDYAVSSATEYIPNIFDHAWSYDGGSKLQLENRETSCVYPGLKLKVYYNDENNFQETVVINIIDSRNVLCDPPLKTVGKVFVFGQQVDDFKVLNKEAIFTVGIAAIQEIDRELQEQKAIVAALVTRIELLEARL
jgi:hypothetical protein